VVATVRELAQQHSHEAIRRLAWLMAHGKPDHVRLAAAAAILDRAIGRPAQAIMVDGPPAALGVQIVLAGDGGSARFDASAGAQPSHLTLHLPVQAEAD
jgi:hypothetical protein